jgi:hypothetical protein
VKISVSEGDAHHGPQDAVESLDKPIGNALNKVIEDFFPPIAERDDELGQVFVAAPTGFENPGRQKSSGLLPIVDFVEDPPEFFFEQIEGSKLRTEIEQLGQLGFLRRRQFASIPYKEPTAALDFGSHFG